jgi:hypothetical protein
MVLPRENAATQEGKVLEISGDKTLMRKEEQGE